MLIIPSHERLIVALDVPTSAAARTMVQELGQSVVFYKVGLELFMDVGFWGLLDWLVTKQQKKIFVDLKFHDIPRTVGAAVKNLAQYGVSLTTIHVAQSAMIEAAAEAKGKMQLLGVTVLTSMITEDLSDVGYTGEIADLAKMRAVKAVQHGCDGVVCSALEAQVIRASIGGDKWIVTPGIRHTGVDNGDQQRVADIPTALANSADYLVVGRPILHSKNPRQTAESMQALIAKTVGR